MTQPIPRSVLILGGTSGIGLETNLYLRRMGMTVWAHGREDFDINDRGALREAVVEAQPTHVVYSVGINILDWIQDINQGDFRKIIQTNVWGFIALMQELRRTGRTHSVVAVTSDAGRRPMRTSLAYCASKAALDMAVKVASRELASYGWRINGVAPGKVEGTEMTSYVDQRVRELRGWSHEQAEDYENESSPIGRALDTAEVAAVITDVLLSESAGWTGDIISINGGRA